MAISVSEGNFSSFSSRREVQLIERSLEAATKVKENEAANVTFSSICSTDVVISINICFFQKNVSLQPLTLRDQQ